MQSIRICPSFPRLNILSLPGLVGPRGLSQTMFISPRQSAYKHSGGSCTVKMFPWMQWHTQTGWECGRRNDNRWNVAVSRRQGPLKARWWHHYGPRKAFPRFHCPGEKRGAELKQKLWLVFSVVGSQIVAATAIHTPIWASFILTLFLLLCSFTREIDSLGLWPVFWGVSLNSGALQGVDSGAVDCVCVSCDRHSREVSGVCLHWWQVLGCQMSAKHLNLKGAKEVLTPYRHFNTDLWQLQFEPLTL